MEDIKSVLYPKPIGEFNEDFGGHGHHAPVKEGEYKKALNAFDLTAMGVGGIIGAGIFSFTGEVAANTAAPAVSLEYFLNKAWNGAIMFDPNVSCAPIKWAEETSSFATTGYSFNVPAFMIVIVLTTILASGVKLSAYVVNVLVVVKVIVVILFIFGGPHPGEPPFNFVTVVVAAGGPTVANEHGALETPESLVAVDADAAHS
ncbi:Cationic amino acid transporter-1, partial [Cladochytrium tenue]